MMLTMRDLGIDKMSVEERLALVQEIWDSIAESPERIPLTGAQRRELERRLMAHEADPQYVIAWDVVKKEAARRSLPRCE